VERQIPPEVPIGWPGSRVHAVRWLPDRLPLSPEWEARARELRRDWTRVAAQIDALVRALQSNVAGGPTDASDGPWTADGEGARQARPEGAWHVTGGGSAGHEASVTEARRGMSQERVLQ
jgi:hypothetical protein